MLGTKCAVPFEGGQQFLPDGGVERMAPGAETCRVQRLGLPVKAAEQMPPSLQRSFARTHYTIALSRCRALKSSPNRENRRGLPSTPYVPR